MPAAHGYTSNLLLDTLIVGGVGRGGSLPQDGRDLVS